MGLTNRHVTQEPIKDRSLGLNGRDPPLRALAAATGCSSLVRAYLVELRLSSPHKPICLKTNPQKSKNNRERVCSAARKRSLRYRKGMILTRLAIGLVAGLLSGFLGIAGGTILIPAMVLLLHLDQKTAQGTSLAVLLPPTGLLAFIEYYRHGWVSLHLSVLMVIGVTVGAFGGAYPAAQRWATSFLRRNSRPPALCGCCLQAQFVAIGLLRKMFAVFLVLIAVRVWFE